MTSIITKNASAASQVTAQQREIVALIVNEVLDSVQVAGAHGAPAGVIYAALMTQGCTLSQFQSLMSALVSAGKLRHEADSNLYFIV